MNIRAVVLIANKPMIDGTVYDREALQAAVDEYHLRDYALTSITPIIDIKSSTHKVINLELIGDELIATLSND